MSTEAGITTTAPGPFDLAAYHKFIESKRLSAVQSGFDVPVSALNASLKPWQALLVQWGLKLGRACLFEFPGLGKTLQQLVWAEQVCKHTGRPVLILCPLGVRHQTLQEAQKFNIDAPIQVSQSGQIQDGITITNYDRAHHFDADAFAGVVCDESGCLQDFTSKTTEELTARFRATPYKLCCTATPAPNDHMELGTHAEFVGAMGRNEMLSMFFVHDGGDTSKWRLRGHAVDKFWEWMATWAVMIRVPADIGFPDESYNLPPLEIYEHIVETPIVKGRLFQASAATLGEQRAARRETIGQRIEKLIELLDPTQPAAIFCGLNDESVACTKALCDLGFGAIEITGSQPDYVKEDRLSRFAACDPTARQVISKARICGRGLNWQHCSQIFLLGLSHSWADFFQIVSRCHRFAQTKTVRVHVIISDRDDRILANIRRKQTDADRMAEGMIRAMASHTAKRLHDQRETLMKDYRATERMRLPKWMA